LEQKFSQDILRGAQGIALITEMKAGFSVGINGGSGIILCRDKNGNWSGPCAIGMGGVSWGFAAGISKVDHIIILPTIHHVRTFMANSSLQVRGNIEACVADIGRDANVGFGISEKAASSILSYSFSTKGLYGGVNIEGAIIASRHACNEAFYQKKVSVADIANGDVQMVKENEDYQTIVRLLNDYSQSMSMAIHDNGSQISNNNNNNINNNVTTNLTNDKVSMPETTEPIISEKPPLIRQKEVSLNTIIQHDVSNSITNMDNNNNMNKDNNNSAETQYPNLKNIQPL